jgi:hypothetical protein
MMAMLGSIGTRSLVLLAVALALALSATGCATGPLGSATGSLASHGVDYTPAFDAPRYGNLGIESGFLTRSPTE